MVARRSCLRYPLAAFLPYLLPSTGGYILGSQRRSSHPRNMMWLRSQALHKLKLKTLAAYQSRPRLSLADCHAGRNTIPHRSPIITRAPSLRMQSSSCRAVLLGYLDSGHDLLFLTSMTPVTRERRLVHSELPYLHYPFHKT